MTTAGFLIRQVKMTHIFIHELHHATKVRMKTGNVTNGTDLVLSGLIEHRKGSSLIQYQEHAKLRPE